MPRDSESPIPHAEPAQRWVKIALFAVLAIAMAWIWLSSQGGGSAGKRQNTPTASTGDSAESRPASAGTTDRDTATQTKRPSYTPKRDDTADEYRAKQPAAPRKNPSTARPDADRDDASFVVHNARVTDEDKRVIYHGDIDLTATVQRIERGKRLRFSNDGSEFQNRERRLPKKPDGYYREYVHPTPGNDGPGGQRVVTGRDGEIYYTPDHYRTFQRVR